MQCPVTAGLVGEWQPVSFVSADQFFSKLAMFGTTMPCCLIPASCESLPDSCFAGSRIVRVTFASGSVLKRIGKEAFGGCGQLREIEIPACVEEIGEACFYGCSSLSRVTFASGSALKRIGKGAFSGCKQLREIEIPACVEEIGEGCFQGCDVAELRISGGNKFFAMMGPLIVARNGMRAVCTFRNVTEIEIPACVEVDGSLDVRIGRHW